MKDIRTIIDARVAMGASVVKKAQVINLHVAEGSNGRFPIAITLSKDVTGMIQVTQLMVDNANRAKAVAEEAYKKAVDANAENVEDLKVAFEEATAAANALVLDSWIEGKTNVVWSSNYELNALLRQNPKTAFLAKKMSRFGEKEREVMEDMYFAIFGFGTTSILDEAVTKDMEYVAPFSDKVTTIKNNSHYHTLFEFALGEEGEATVKALRRRHMDALMAKAEAATSRKSDDDEDDDND